MLEELPLCNRLIRNLHETLLAGVRGHDKARGKFRKIQNYIGAYGVSIDKARFIPVVPEQGVRPVNHIFKAVHGREMMFGAPS